MSPRFAPALALVLVTLTAAACASGSAAQTPPSPVVSPVAPPVVAPTPTRVPTPTVVPDPTPTPSVNAGDVDAGPGPQLTVEFPGARLLDITLEDAAARAWRVVVQGTDARSTDRLEVVVESGDVAPAITATEIQDGEVTSTFELGGFVDDSGASGGCHRTLDVCVDSSSFRFSDDGTGRLRIRLQMPDQTDGTLLVTGATAGWPGEPFVLGPWSDTETFPWGQG